MRFFVATVLLAFGLTATSAEATFIKERSLYQPLGGQQAIIAVVDDVAADKRINRFFANTDMPRLKRRLVEQICADAGGPCEYKGCSMRAAHRGLGIRGLDVDALVQDLGKTQNEFKVPAREQTELVALLAPMRKDIVEL